MKKCFQVAHRRAQVARLHLQGLTQLEISARLGLPPGAGAKMISVDVKAIREQWRQSAVRDFDERMSEQLAKLHHLARELWEAWERSRSGNRDGNARFTGQILTCIHEQSELLGLTDRRAQAAQGPPIVGFQIFEPDEEAPAPAEPAPREARVVPQAN
jgi:hypothetical protein